MKKYRIVRLSKNFYRVDKQHKFLFISYWDFGASDMCPNYRFDSYSKAVNAIRDAGGRVAMFIDKVNNFTQMPEDEF